MSADPIREFTAESPIPASCFGVLKADGLFPIDQPMIRELALAYIETQICKSAFLRFESSETAGRMTAAAWRFQHLAACVATEYILAAHNTMKGLPYNAKVEVPLLQPDADSR